MSWQTARSIVTLQEQLDTARPGRRKPDGVIGDPAHAARVSDHNPDDDRDVCAVDVYDGPALDDGELYESLKEAGSRNPQLKYTINNGRIYSPTKGENPYDGPNAHVDHCHVSVTQARKNDTRAWFLPGITHDQEDDDVTPQDRALLVRIEKKLDALTKDMDALTAPRLPGLKDRDPNRIDLGDVLNDDKD